MTTVTTGQAKGLHIRELWDLGQEVPADSPSESGPL